MVDPLFHENVRRVQQNKRLFSDYKRFLNKILNIFPQGAARASIKNIVKGS